MGHLTKQEKRTILLALSGAITHSFSYKGLPKLKHCSLVFVKKGTLNQTDQARIFMLYEKSSDSYIFLKYFESPHKTREYVKPLKASLETLAKMGVLTACHTPTTVTYEIASLYKGVKKTHSPAPTQEIFQRQPHQKRTQKRHQPPNRKTQSNYVPNTATPPAEPPKKSVKRARLEALLVNNFRLTIAISDTHSRLKLLALQLKNIEDLLQSKDLHLVPSILKDTQYNELKGLQPEIFRKGTLSKLMLLSITITTQDMIKIAKQGLNSRLPVPESLLKHLDLVIRYIPVALQYDPGNSKPAVISKAIKQLVSIIGHTNGNLTHTSKMKWKHRSFDTNFQYLRKLLWFCSNAAQDFSNNTNLNILKINITSLLSSLCSESACSQFDLTFSKNSGTKVDSQALSLIGLRLKLAIRYWDHLLKLVPKGSRGPVNESRENDMRRLAVYLLTKALILPNSKSVETDIEAFVRTLAALSSNQKIKVLKEFEELKHFNVSVTDRVIEALQKSITKITSKLEDPPSKRAFLRIYLLVLNESTSCPNINKKSKVERRMCHISFAKNTFGDLCIDYENELRSAKSLVQSNKILYLLKKNSTFEAIKIMVTLTNQTGFGQLIKDQEKEIFAKFIDRFQLKINTIIDIVKRLQHQKLGATTLIEKLSTLSIGLTKNNTDAMGLIKEVIEVGDQLNRLLEKIDPSVEKKLHRELKNSIGIFSNHCDIDFNIVFLK